MMTLKAGKDSSGDYCYFCTTLHSLTAKSRNGMPQKTEVNYRKKQKLVGYLVNYVYI